MRLRSGSILDSTMAGKGENPGEEPAWLSKIVDRLDSIERSVTTLQRTSFPETERSISSLHERLEEITQEKETEVDKIRNSAENTQALEAENRKSKTELVHTKVHFCILRASTGGIIWILLE